MITPTPGFVVLKVIDESETNVGGIIVIQQDEMPKKATVHAVDIDCKRVLQGQTVIYSPYAGIKAKDENVEYLIVKEDEILAVIS